MAALAPVATASRNQSYDLFWGLRRPSEPLLVAVAVAWALCGPCSAALGGGLTALRAPRAVAVAVLKQPSAARPHPKGYVCYRASEASSPSPISLDGRLEEEAWRAAPWTDLFLDIEGASKPAPRHRTRAKMLWDDDCFYVAAELEEPHVWGTLAVRDSVIFHDNDFELFIDPDGDTHHYGEFEINALNTGWDLRLPLPYKDGGRADDGWDMKGLKTAVAVSGTLNDPRDVDQGWSIEIAIPWKAVASLTDDTSPRREAVRSGSLLKGYAEISGGMPRPVDRRSQPIPIPPGEGDQWRLNFSRVQWRHEVVGNEYRKVKDVREDNWVWSPQGVIDMHRPETWGYVQFSARTAVRAQTDPEAFRPDACWPVREFLRRIYNAQHTFRKQHGAFASTLEELGEASLPPESELLASPPVMESSGERFEVRVQTAASIGSSQEWRIREDSLIWSVPREADER